MRRSFISGISGTEIGKILSLTVLTVVALTATILLARAYHRTQEASGRRWYNQGEEAFQSSDFVTAANDFRTALSDSPENSDYQLRLAQALLRLGKLDQAQSYLLSLWHNEPGNGLLNLELARVAVRRNDSKNALRFFHTAIFGVWDGDREGNRLTARFELVQYLIKSRLAQQADSELIALSAELPPDAALHLKAAELFAQVGNTARALTEYQAASSLDSRSLPALLGAGNASFAMSQYDVARGYFLKAQAVHESDEAAKALKSIAEIQSLDPYARGISYSARVGRVLAAFSLAGNRLQACGLNPLPAQSTGDPAHQVLAGAAADWQALHSRVTQTALRHDPDLLEAAAESSLKVEDAADRAGCPVAGPEDNALLAIARRRGIHP